jgi:hypothetical protein
MGGRAKLLTKAVRRRKKCGRGNEAMVREFGGS